jgi:Flp pilus assembly protein TadB
VTYAIVIVSLLVSAGAVTLSVLSIRLNMRAEQSWRRVASKELELAEMERRRHGESPWKSASRERWDADHGAGDFDRRLAEARKGDAA